MLFTMMVGFQSYSAYVALRNNKSFTKKFRCHIIFLAAVVVVIFN